MPDNPKTWNQLVERLESFFKEAIGLAESKPYKDLSYIKGYKAGLTLALSLIQDMKIDESRLAQAPEEYH